MEDSVCVRAEEAAIRPLRLRSLLWALWLAEKALFQWEAFIKCHKHCGIHAMRFGTACSNVDIPVEFVELVVLWKLVLWELA